VGWHCVDVLASVEMKDYHSFPIALKSCSQQFVSELQSGQGTDERD
jgi:hypothetical protein